MPYIERRRNLWYALLTIPEDVREKLGKLRFIQSLGTPDKTEATILAAPLIGKWKAMSREARGVTNALNDEANRWKRHFATQEVTDREMGDHWAGVEVLEDELRARVDARTKVPSLMR